MCTATNEFCKTHPLPLRLRAQLKRWWKKKKVKSHLSRRTREKQCLLGISGPPHSWTDSGCYCNKTYTKRRQSTIQHRGACGLGTIAPRLGATDNWRLLGKKSVFFKGVAPGVSMCQWMAPHLWIFWHHKLDLANKVGSGEQKVGSYGGTDPGGRW